MGLPAENFFLGLAGGGDSMMMCTWASPALNADVIAKVNGDARQIAGFEVECAAGKPVWLAFMETKGLWRWYRPTEEQQKDGQDVTLDWRMPFAAKWRGGDLNSQVSSPKCAIVNWHNRGMIPRHRIGSGTVSILKGAVTVHRFTSMRSDGQVVMSTLDPLIFYPLDRNAETPLDVFTPMDVLRNTLGVGPCQYVLDTEGLGSEEAATPEVTAAWLEKRLARPDAAAAGDEIKTRLRTMAIHVSLRRPG